MREVPLLLGDAPEIGVASRGRVVHEHVDVTERVERVLHDRRGAVPRGRRGVGDRGAAGGLDLGDDAGRVGTGATAGVVHEHRRALGGEQARVLAADAAARASDDHDLAVESSAHVAPRGSATLATDRAGAPCARLNARLNASSDS